MKNPPPTKASTQGTPTDDQRVVVGSPLAIIGIFVEILRARFAAGNGPTDWVWNANLNETAIVIESGFAEGNTERAKKPAIFVDKDESVYGKVVIGDRAGIIWSDMSDYQWTLSTVPVIVECVASKRGESAIIGDVVQWTLHCASDPIQAFYAFHDMTPPTLGRTTPYEADREAWVTPVSFQVQYPVRWRITPIRTLLQEVQLRVQDADATAHYLDIATYKTGV
ncbi:hypothetical protein KJ782_07245 [Patescibacteria group bacterium]|nr:hypothetical protein [Patescibacteria group bacterium]